MSSIFTPRSRSGNVVQRPDVRIGADGTLQHALAPMRQCRFSAGDVLGKARTMFIQNPSSRLKCSIETYFDPDPSQLPIANFVSGTNYYAVRAFANAEQAGQAFLHPIIDGLTDTRANLPGSYELDTGVKIVRYFTAMVPPRTAGAADIYGNWMTRVMWEPNVGGMEHAEFNHLIAHVSASLPLNAANLVL